MASTFTAKNGQVYNVDKLIELSKKLPVISLPLELVVSNLEESRWSDEENDPESKLPNFGAREVLKFHEKERKYEYHYQKTKKSDLSFPIIIDKDYVVIDGMHRLLKAFMEGYKNVKVIIFKRLPIQAKLK
jgi:hypothetical protein